jgi:hypothetical protein
MAIGASMSNGDSSDDGVVEIGGVPISAVPESVCAPDCVAVGNAVLAVNLSFRDFLPSFQFYCGEEFFQHQLPFDRSSLTRWRQRSNAAAGKDALLDRGEGRVHRVRPHRRCSRTN